MEITLHSKFGEMEIEELNSINGGYTIEEYELAVLSVTTGIGCVVSLGFPAVGAGIIMLGWAMCVEAEEAGGN